MIPGAELGFPGGAGGTESACQCRRCGLDPWVRKIPWRRAWQPTAVFMPGESHGQRGLAGTYSTQGCKELHMMKWLSTSGAWFPNIYALIGSTCSTSRVKAFKLQMVVQAPPSATAFSNYYLGPPGSKIVHMRVSRTCCLNNLGSVSLASSKQSEQNCQPFSLVAIFS